MDAAAGEHEQVGRADRGVGRMRQAGPLAGRQHRHGRGQSEQRLAHGRDGVEHFGVGFVELVADPVGVQVIGTGQPDELLPGPEREAHLLRSADRSEHRAVAVDRHLRAPPDVLESREPDEVDAHHHARAAGVDHEVVVRLEPVDVVGDVERVHRLDAGAVGMALQHGHDGAHALGQRSGGAVALQLVVLDEVDSRGGELADEFAELVGREADAGLHDRSDHRAVGPAHQPACARRRRTPGRGTARRKRPEGRDRRA